MTRKVVIYSLLVLCVAIALTSIYSSHCIFGIDNNPLGIRSVLVKMYCKVKV